jgi:hypothetical protein
MANMTAAQESKVVVGAIERQIQRVAKAMCVGKTEDPPCSNCLDAALRVVTHRDAVLQALQEGWRAEGRDR